MNEQVVETLIELPAHLRNSLATALETGLLRLDSNPTAVRANLSLRGGREQDVLRLLAEWRQLGIAEAAAATWLRSLGRLASTFTYPDLVWSGPEVPGLHARDTRRVYDEIIGSATRSIWACTYAFFDGPRAFEALAEKMDSQRELEVTLLLNIERKRGDTTAADYLVRRFAERFWKRDWPGSSQPWVFYDPRSLEAGGAEGVLHAKGVVADEEVAFITSANFTEAALDRNIEMGLLSRDRHLALTVVRHFQTLIDRKLLRPLPMD